MLAENKVLALDHVLQWSARHNVVMSPDAVTDIVSVIANSMDLLDESMALCDKAVPIVQGMKKLMGLSFVLGALVTNLLWLVF